MPLIEVTVQHGRTIEEARRRLETAVEEISRRFGGMIRRTDWAQDRNGVTLYGVAFRVEMKLDDRAVHVKADVPGLDGLLGAPLASGLKQIVENTFRKLP